MLGIGDEQGQWISYKRAYSAPIEEAFPQSYAERQGGELVAAARQLRANPNGRPKSLRKIAAALAERGYLTPSGRLYSASAVASMLQR
jgi:hypothetical protein